MTVPRPVEVSGREAEVLAALGEHLTNTQIAHRLHLSVRTVEGHVSSLLRKYGATVRRELADLVATRGDHALAPGGIAGVPVAHTSFVGRAREIESILNELTSSRLVTLLGPGGIGKSRLAATAVQQVGARFPFGGAFVDLVPAGDGSVLPAVAAALDVAENAEQPLAGAIVERLARGRSLLVLDNCEHLIGEAAELAGRLLAACPTATILVTSRERLGVPGERILPIGPLPLGSEAEALFRDRALAVQPGFAAEAATVTDLCARLDGMPLAIELAAARSASVGMSGLLTGLGDYLRLLAGGRGPEVRHRSLGSVIDWSHRLLDGDEQSLFRRLAIFQGGFDIDAAMSVSTGDPAAVIDVLGRLVDKSLVGRRSAGGRWRMLQTIRAFAVEQLRSSGEYEEVQGLHLRWAGVVATRLRGRLDNDWRDDFDAVADDLRVAVANAAPGPESHRLARSLGHLCFGRRFLVESIRQYRTAAERAPSPADAAQDLRTAAHCTMVATLSGRDTWDLLLASAEQARAAGDGNAEAIALAEAVTLAGGSPALFAEEISLDGLLRLLDRARAAGDPGDPRVAARITYAAVWTVGPLRSVNRDRAEEAYDAAVILGDPVLISTSLDALAAAAAASGRMREAAGLWERKQEYLTLLDRNDPYSAMEIVDSTIAATRMKLITGDLIGALAAARRALADELTGSISGPAAAEHAPPLVLLGEFDQAIEYAELVWHAWQRSDRRQAGWLSAACSSAALAAGLRGDRRAYEVWLDRGLAAAGVTEEFFRRIPSVSFVATRVAVHSPDHAGAVELVHRAFGDLPPGGPFIAYTRPAAAELAVVAGMPGAAERIAAAAPFGPENDWAAACLARARGRLHHDIGALNDALAGWEHIGARFERACTLLLLPDRAEEGLAEFAALGVPGPGSVGWG